MLSKNNLHGIGWMVFRCLIFSVLALCYGMATKSIHVFEVFFLATGLRLLMTLPWVVYSKGEILKTKNPRFFVFRAAITTVGHLLWVYALKVLPINEATALSYTAPLFTTLICITFLKEEADFKRMVALFVGFLGAMLIIRPDIYGISFGQGLVLGMAMLWATTDTIIKMMTSSESVGGQLFHNSLLMTCFSAPLAMMVFEMPSLETWGWLVLAAFLSMLNNMTIFISYAKADLAIVAPFNFTRLVFTALLAYFLLGQMLTVEEFFGSAVIVASTVYITTREAKKVKKKAILA
jgi:drug/metabolite transporter (DMT)-like permease